MHKTRKKDETTTFTLTLGPVLSESGKGTLRDKAPSRWSLHTTDKKKGVTHTGRIQSPIWRNSEK